MTSMDLKIGIVLLVQIIIGILGNFSLLYHISLYFNGGRSRCTYMIFKHLTIANTLVIISRGIPETMVAFGLKHFLNGFGCKVVFYVHRVARGVSIGITCLLSVFQAITISPRNSRWAKLKVKALKYIGPSSILCWILNMLVNIIVLTRETEKWSNKNITTTIDFKYCSATLCDKGTALLNAVLVSTPGVLCLGLMTWASVSIVFLLCRHKQRVQHIYRNNISPRFSSETRATQIILVLVSIFVCFYTFSSIIYIYFSFSGKSTRWLVNTSALINSCFPTASPLILLSCNPSVSRHFCACTRRNTLLPHLVRKI
ncbi:vomeronasal type-1 receptor 2-like [Diceros bicornis minor]|uniref:vomeronasal type-1 receptor 2-like n=1 Tax=Diceros bicornis minor TaxID=77932 RepID=UPI0026ED9721|nr:vomeronasal type-1 receptor 2-like [Diceros bicornis minor]